MKMILHLINPRCSTSSLRPETCQFRLAAEHQTTSAHWYFRTDDLMPLSHSGYNRLSVAHKPLSYNSSSSRSTAKISSWQKSGESDLLEDKWTSVGGYLCLQEIIRAHQRRIVQHLLRNTIPKRHIQRIICTPLLKRIVNRSRVVLKFPHWLIPKM